MRTVCTPQPSIVSAFPTQSHATSLHTTKASMLELGIVLLEIWHMRCINNYASEKALKMDNSYGTRYEIARYWLKFSDDNMLPFYLELLSRCIECTFATTSATPDWCDLTFRKSVCEHVLKFCGRAVHGSQLTTPYCCSAMPRLPHSLCDERHNMIIIFFCNYVHKFHDYMPRIASKHITTSYQSFGAPTRDPAVIWIPWRSMDGFNWSGFVKAWPHVLKQWVPYRIIGYI